ncbi:MAG TPA: hypothetical protein VIK65_09000 [Candidatus Limnocylindrales bacterium]|jgi:hypothetical protein
MAAFAALRSFFAAVAVLLVAVGGCAPVVTFPPESAAPAVVLDTYLMALAAGDCQAGRRLALTTFAKGKGELCGETRLISYRVDLVPATFSDREVVFAAHLTTTGTADRSVPPGEMLWFYDLLRQPNGAWRLAGGGSGP